MDRPADSAVIPITRARRPSALPERTDDELMELASASLKEAFAELVRRYGDRVRNYCNKWDPQRGDDLAQEVFFQLWNARERYQPTGQFQVYLFTIVRNRCRNAKRSWIRRPPLEPLPPSLVDPGRGDQLDAMLEWERNRRVQRSVTALPPKLKEAVLLRFGEGLSYAEMATILRAPEPTIRSRVFLGLRRLQQELGA
jgi:RNA polymerase sigma-70 factor (ECF subfamily)